MSDYGFRCKTCGRLHTCGTAAEADHPHACMVCGSGVSFCPKTGKKTVHPENWEYLHEASDERLAELGLSREQVKRHESWPKGSPSDPKHVTASIQDGPGTQDSA